MESQLLIIRLLNRPVQDQLLFKPRNMFFGASQLENIIRITGKPDDQAAVAVKQMSLSGFCCFWASTQSLFITGLLSISACREVAVRGGKKTDRWSGGASVCNCKAARPGADTVAVEAGGFVCRLFFSVHQGREENNQCSSAEGISVSAAMGNGAA